MHINDIQADSLQNSFSEPGNATGALLTVTHAAAVGRRFAVVKVDASYSVSTVSGLLTVIVGSTTIGPKYIHGSGAIDFGTDVGFICPENTACSATLDSGGGGTVGTIVISGFSTAP